MDAHFVSLTTESPIAVRIKGAHSVSAKPAKIWLYTAKSSADEPWPEWLQQCVKPGERVIVLEPRGVGASRWTTKNPPNYVERSLYLLGRSADSGRVWDIMATARYLRAGGSEATQVYLAGEGSAAVLAAYAALLEPEIAGVVLCRPFASHMDSAAPQLLGALRALDIPQAIGMLAPKPVTLIEAPEECVKTASELYRRAGASDKLVVLGN